MTLQKDPELTEIRYLDSIVEFTGKRVLEIGCGEGRLTWRYSRSSGCVTGIDPDMDALRVAVKDCLPDLHETISFARASSLYLPFSHDSFDIAILAWSL